MDAEVTVDFPNYSLFREDIGLSPGGNPRDGGCVFLNLRDEFSGDCLATFDKIIDDMLVVKIHRITTDGCPCLSG